ncbi:MAG: NirD/YgiW/YdeI family stress tolerance protein, partial [Candidatus Accumulibacter sp.]|nr:NirD/YgiW/YdeI family stress tolerance protein [Accumulibacter sp.]
IIRHLGKDKYLFKDATGEITVEIDDDEWGGQTITPDDLVELQGEIDKEWRRVEIDVDRVLPLKQGKP